MKTALLYDIKRSLLKPVVLFMLILFAVLGIATTYSMYTFIANTYTPIEGAAMHIIAIDRNSTSCILIGGIFDRRGDLVEGSVAFIVNNSKVYGFEGASTFTVENPNICRYNIEKIEVSTQLLKFNITCNTVPLNRYPILLEPTSVSIPYSSQAIANSTSHVAVSLCGRVDGYLYIDSALVVFKMLINNLRSARARLYVFSVNISSMNTGLEKPIVLNYTFSAIAGTRNNKSQGSIAIKDPLEKFDLTLDLDKNFIQFYPIKDSKSSVTSISYSYQIYVERSYINFITGSLGIGLYLSFFPIAVIYISNILVSKPRSNGALEFVLARPITRFDLYLSRYLAGVILIAISSFILLTVIAIFQPLVLRIEFDLWSYILLYLGVSASLITFYTLCYTIASIARSGLYLAISIALYILFSMMWSVITVFTAMWLGISIMSQGYEELTYMLSYLNPLNFVNLARYHILLSYGAIHDIPTINSPLCMIIPLAWNLTLFVIGFWRFKKVNLTS
ncbi:MAG: ABC transporter permease subunit [Ignisphaera sp.]